MKNILNKFTKRNLKLNSKRTIATCVGIILSTALICAVAGVFSSFQKTLIQHAKMSDGDYHTVFYDIPQEKQKYITENRNVENYFITQNVGYAQLKGSKNKYKPYLHLMEFDENALNNWGLKLINGRMPENSDELIISKAIEENGGVKYNIGDKIELKIGKRISNGYELNQYNPYTEDGNGNNQEQIENEQLREFTIVGIIERPNMEIEEYSAPGYTIITKLNEKKENTNILVKYKNIKNTYKTTEKIEKTLDGGYNYHVNSELVRWSGVSRADDTTIMLYSLAGIVIAIIVISSIFVIRNSFAISITEKMKQYGMLASIGATKKQIKRNVLFEGMILGIISIPIGILLGIIATYILIQITTLLIGNIAFSTEMKFIFNMPIEAIILSIILGFITIYISCIFSARKASKVSPIEAIRNNDDIKIKSKKIKSPKIIKKIFGIGGEIAYKNLKRNKKKYRTTVISLVVSITVFISLNTFMNYVFGISSIYYKEMNYNINLNIDTDKETTDEKAYKYLQNLAKNNDLKEYSILRTAYINTDSLEDKETKEYQNYIKDTSGEPNHLVIVSLGETEYKRYVKEIGEKYEKCKDGIIYYDNSVIYDKDAKKIKCINIAEEDRIKGTVKNKNDETSSDKKVDLEIVKIADKAPMNNRNVSNYGMFIVSDELMDKIGEYYCYNMKINSNNPDEFCKKIDEEKDVTLTYTNYKEIAEQENRMVLLISIFLYGFIIVITLIGVTNIFNTITTNMNLRSKEFAMLKSIGMTKKEFNKMINLESIFYGIKSLIIGIILGLGISYFIYKIVIGADATEQLQFIIPTKPIIISIIFIIIIVGIIMRYSLSKINKQNIIETIRNENI